MSFDKLKDFEQAAKKAEEEFLALTKPSEPAPSEPVATEPPTATEPPVPPTEPPAEPAQPTFNEEEYKKQVKAMNAAQKAASEAEKRLKEFEERSKAEEERYNQILEKARQASATPAYEPEDELESDMPEVAKLAERKAKGLLSPLEQKLQELESRLKAREEFQQKLDAETQAKTMLNEIKSAHPDYDEVVNSDEMVAWVNNQAPPMYKRIFDGSVQFDAKDAIEVINAYKRTTTPTQRAQTSPSAAEIAAPVKNNPQIATKLQSENPPTAKELEWFMHNSHRLKPEEVVEWDRRIALLTT